MDEKALQDIFGYAVSNGYRGDINQFKNLLSSDSNALDDVYNYAVSNGYQKSLDDFKGLIGISADVKKKEVSDLSLGQDISSSATPEIEAPTPSAFSRDEKIAFTNITRDILSDIDKGDAGTVKQKYDELISAYQGYDDPIIEEEINALRAAAKSKNIDLQTGYMYPKEREKYGWESFKGIAKNGIEAGMGPITNEEFSKRVLENAGKSLYDKVSVTSDDLWTVPTFNQQGSFNQTEWRKESAKNLQEKYGDYGITFTANENPYLGGDISVISDDGRSIEINVTDKQALQEETDKLKKFIYSVSAGEKKRDFTPQELLFYSKREDFQNISKQQYDRVFTDENIKAASDYINKKNRAIASSIKKEREERDRLELAYLENPTEENAKKYDDQANIVDLKYYDMKSNAKLLEIAQNNIILERQRKNLESTNWGVAGSEMLLDGVKSVLKGFGSVVYGGLEVANRGLNVIDMEGAQDYIRKEEKFWNDLIDEKIDPLKIGKATEEYWKDASMAKTALLNVPAMLPALALPNQTLGFFLLDYGSRMEEYEKDPKMKEMMSMEEARLFNALNSSVQAKLENIGLTQALSKSGLANSLLMKSLKKWSKKSGAAGLNRALNAEINNAAVKAGLNTTGAFIVETETGALQNFADTGLKQLYNEAKSKEVFEQPKMFTEEWIQNLRKDAILEGLGGMWMGGAVNIAKYAKDGIVGARTTNQEYKRVREILDDKLTVSFLANHLNTQVLFKKMTREDADEILNSYRNAQSIVDSMPEDLPVESQRKAFDLIREKQKLEISIKDKDENLVARQKKRITEINNELQNLSENAVQEQTTSEVPLQPEASVGEEVAERKPETEPKITAKEGEKEIVSGVEITYPTAKQAEERKSERNKPEYVEASSENLQEEDVDMLKEDLSGEFGLLTAENPMAQPLTEEENAKLNEKAEAWLRERGYNPRRVTGKYDQAENSFFVKGLTKEDAIAFAKEFNQESVAHSEGLVYQDGSMNPRVKSSDNFSFEEYTPESNYVSVVKTKDGLKTFSIGYDFETKTKPTEQQQKLAEEQRTQAPVQGSKLRQNIQKAVEKVFGKFETKSFKNGKEMADYARKNFNQEVRPNESARMFYDNGDLVVLVNEELADDTSFGHEIWHGILLKAFGDNQVLFRQFRDEVDAALREAGYDAIADKLDAFAEQYAKTGLMAEEWLVQLGGMLTSARIDPKNLKRKQKTLLQKLKDIVNKFAIEITGQPVFLEDAKAEDILSFMTTMSDMMSKGEDISGFFTDAEGGDSKTRAQVVGVFSGQLEEMGISVGTTNKKTGKTKVTNFDIASSLNEYYNKTYGKIDPNDFSKKAVDAVSEYATTEMLFALSEFGDNSGKGWYTEDYSKALDTLSYLDESIKNDPKIKEVATAIIAVASNSSDVYTNLTRLIYGLDGFKSSNAVPLDVGTGKGASAIAAGIKRYNQLLEKFDNDPTKVASFMQQIDTISNLKKKLLSEFGLNSYAQALKENLATNPEWNENETLPMSVLIFGPKIGAFYSNLSGLDGTPTIDRWCIRTIYRYKGDMRAKVSSKEMNAFMEENKIVGASESDALSLAEEHAKLFNAILSGKGEYKGLEKSKRNEMLKPYRKGSQIWAKAKGVVNDISEGADDTVKNKSQYGKDFRSFTKEVFEKARDMVADKAGIKLSVSDVQAILWIYEKNLFGHLGVKQREDSTYSSAANSLVSKVQSGALTVDMLKSGDLKALSTPDIETEGPMGDKFGSDATSYKEGIDGRQKRSEKGVNIKTRAQKVIPDDVMSQLTEDENGNIVFMHFSDEKRDYIRPSSGERGLTTSREESQAISSVGGLAMFYVQEGQKEANVGNVANTVLVPKEKVYYFNSDPLNFYDEARRQFQEHMNRGKDKKTDFAFNPNYQVAWITKVANENGFDIVVSKWRGDKDFRAQTTERLATEDKVTEFKRSMNKIEVGDKILIQGKEAIVTEEDTRLNRMIYEYKDSNGDVVTGYFIDSPMSRVKPEIIEKGPITRAQKVNVDGIQGYERMQSNIDSIIEKTKRRGADKNRIYEDALNYMQKSATYERATDIQREQLVRDLRKKLGIRQKSAPKPDRILGNVKDATKITVNEKSALKEMIRRQAKAAKTAIAAYRSVAKILVKEIKDLQTKGKISVRQMTSVLRRFEATDMLNPDAVSRFVDYMAKVFNDAAYFERISKINNKIRTARKNANKKLGIVEDLRPLIEKVLSINPTLIPDNIFDIYEEMVMMLSERASVLSLQEIEDVKSKFSKISDAISEQESRVNELYDIFESFKDKVVDDSGKVDYAATIAKMQDEGIIMSEDAELMKKYKSQILGISERSKRSDEEIEEERQENIDAVKQSDIFAGRLTMRDERNLAQAIRDIMKDDRVLQRMSAKDVADLLKIIDNINNGYIPSYAQILYEKMEAKLAVANSVESIKKAKILPIERIISKIKSLFTGRTAQLEAIRRNPLIYIDQVLGNFKGTQVFDAFLDKVARAHSKYTSELNEANTILENAEAKLFNSLGRNPNKLLRSKFKMMAYLIQMEHESNPGNKESSVTAMEFLRETIKQAELGDIIYGDIEADMLLDIIDKFTTNDQIDVSKIEKSFTKEEKASIEAIRKVNDSISDKAVYTAGVIRGENIKPRTNYIHLHVISQSKKSDKEVGVKLSQEANSRMRPSTRGKSLIQREGVASALNFDPFASTARGAKFTLLDYHMTAPVRTVRRLFNEMDNELEGESRETRKVFRAIRESVEEALTNTLTNDFEITSFADDVMNELQKAGYATMLAGIPRATSEFLSNATYVLATDPNVFTKASKYFSVMNTADGINVLRNVNSKQAERIYPTHTLSGRMIDTSVLNNAVGLKTSNAKNKISNVMSIIYNYSLKPTRSAAEFVSESLISTPDKAIMRPLWFVKFSEEFKKVANVEPDFEKISQNNEAYMAKYKEAIKSASAVADDVTVKAGASDNAFTGILKGKVKSNMSTTMKFFNRFNNFMQRLMIYEYTTARTGVHALVGNGTISKSQGARLMAGVTLRMIAYNFLIGVLGKAFYGLFPDGEDEEDKDTLLQEAGQATASALTGLILGRNIGNVPKSIINIGIEEVNKEYFDFLRTGEYDPYDDAIAYTITPKNQKKYQQTGVWPYLQGMSGAFSPILRTADFSIKKIDKYMEEPTLDRYGRPKDMTKSQMEARKRLDIEKYRIMGEVAGNLGFIPLYKDIRKVALNMMYKDLKSKKTDRYGRPTEN